MFVNTRGIVFQKINYSESGIIVKIYTEEFGVSSFMVRGVKSKRGTMKSAYFQPLTILDLVITHKERKNLHNIKEAKVSYAYRDIFSDPVKQSILFFLNEILLKTIKEESPDKLLFEWLLHALTWLDLTDKSVVNYHLVFLFQLSRFLGFYPKISGAESSYFDLQEGTFRETRPEHAGYISGPHVEQLTQLRNTTFEDSPEVRISNEDRRKILHTLVTYYQMHLPNIHEIKSLEVLENMMR